MSPIKIDALALPVIVAPMFRVSGPALVTAACRSGVIGSFPAHNCRTTEELDQWLSQIARELREVPQAPPYAVNIVVHRTNPRLQSDLECIVRYQVPIVITSIGSPSAEVIGRIRAYGGAVFADVASLRHARKALTLGVDGLILLCAGAGGNTGWVNPFAFVRAVREFFDGLVVLAGGIMDGVSIRAAQTLGADLVYMGTRFIATEESMASEGYKRMVVDANVDDIILTDVFSGLNANFLKGSIVAAGFDPENLPAKRAINVAEQLDIRSKRWKDIWTAGHGVGAVKEVLSVAQVVAELLEEYRT